MFRKWGATHAGSGALTAAIRCPLSTLYRSGGQQAGGTWKRLLAVGQLDRRRLGVDARQDAAVAHIRVRDEGYRFPEPAVSRGLRQSAVRRTR